MPHVLLVDADNGFRDALAEHLRQDGYRVVTARDGYEALTEVIRRRPDVIVSEIVMPPPDGIRLVEMLRGQGVTIPFLLMTACPNQARRHAADALLVKPFRPDHLAETIRRLLTTEPVLDWDEVRASPSA